MLSTEKRLKKLEKMGNWPFMYNTAFILREQGSLWKTLRAHTLMTDCNAEDKSNTGKTIVSIT